MRGLLLWLVWVATQELEGWRRPDGGQCGAIRGAKGTPNPSGVVRALASEGRFMAWRGRFGFAAGRERLSIVTIPGAEGALAGAYSTASTYNPDGTVASQTLPAVERGGLPAETLWYGYDGLGRPSRLAGQGAYVDATRYTAFGEIAQVVLGAGVSLAGGAAGACYGRAKG